MFCVNIEHSNGRCFHPILFCIPLGLDFSHEFGPGVCGLWVGRVGVFLLQGWDVRLILFLYWIHTCCAAIEITVHIELPCSLQHHRVHEDVAVVDL